VHDYVLGLGSNLGDRLEFFRAAVRHLQDHAQIVALSALYETAAIGPAQPDFLNAAVRLRSGLEPLALLSLQLEIERLAGRVRLVRWGPRTLDLDIVLYGDTAYADDTLTIPHPRMHERAFVLLPLQELAPDRVGDADLQAVTGQRIAPLPPASSPA